MLLLALVLLLSRYILIILLSTKNAIATSLVPSTPIPLISQPIVVLISSVDNGFTKYLAPSGPLSSLSLLMVTIIFLLECVLANILTSSSTI